jgi:O-antigen ligase
MMVAIVCLLGVFVALKVASSTGVDVFYRFRGYKLEHEGYFDTVRGAEFGSLLREIKRAPLGLLTGQGLGMRHQGSLATDTRAHFHNDYLGALFSLGIVGFGCYCFIIFSSIFRGRHYCRDDDLALLIMPVRLVFFALAAYAFLNQTFWLYKGTSLLMAMLAISSNSHHYSVLKAQSDYLMGDLEHDLDYVESVEGMN